MIYFNASNTHTYTHINICIHIHTQLIITCDIYIIKHLKYFKVLTCSTLEGHIHMEYNGQEKRNQLLWQRDW